MDADRESQASNRVADQDRTASRRRILGLGLAAGTFATAFRPEAALAANGDAMKLGQANNATQPTQLTVPTGTAMKVETEANAVALEVTCGESGTGVSSTTQSGTAISGFSSSGTALHAETTFGTGLSVFAADGVAINADGGFGRGITVSSRFTAFEARSPSTAVRASVTSRSPGNYFPIALDADAPDGIALLAKGRVQMDRSGRADVTIGERSVTIPVVGGVSARTLVFAQFRSNPDNLQIRTAAPDADAGTIVIRLSGAVTKPTRLSWFVLD